MWHRLCRLLVINDRFTADAAWRLSDAIKKFNWEVGLGTNTTHNVPKARLVRDGILSFLDVSKQKKQGGYVVLIVKK